ncbi:MAG TPA: type II toxin-antitoxin system death-on-curing family toxin, partial [Polyangiaceae bacterium]|nr:type II toxin-antitoxin system death-on-curing family toxin [Polyangiaceae bacterium]
MKLTEVVFLETEDIVEIHDRCVELWGGAAGVRDPGLLASATAAPQMSAFGDLIHGTLANMAAALAHALAKNHAFVDGNKRVAAASVVAFLRANGIAVQLDPKGWEDVFVGVAIGTIPRSALATQLATAMGGDVEIDPD